MPPVAADKGVELKCVSQLGGGVRPPWNGGGQSWDNGDGARQPLFALTMREQVVKTCWTLSPSHKHTHTQRHTQRLWQPLRGHIVCSTILFSSRKGSTEI